jgi:hypothetical protein
MTRYCSKRPTARAARHGALLRLARVFEMRYSSINTAGTVEKLEALGLCFEPFDGRHVPAWEADTKGLFAFHVRTPSVISEPEIGCQGEKTTGTRYTLRDLSGLLARDRSTTGPSGESNARPIESLPLGNAGGCFDGVPCIRSASCEALGSKDCSHRVHVPRDTFKASLGRARRSPLHPC